MVGRGVAGSNRKVGGDFELECTGHRGDNILNDAVKCMELA